MPFSTQSNEWASRSGLGVVVDSNDSFVNSIFSFNSLTSMTQSQALVLETTTLAVGLWLIFCIVLRFCPLDDGRSRWFRLRYWLSRLDVCFNTRHWLDEQKIMVKRKTELGGTFSVASFIFFLGLSTALLYQIISKRSVEVQNIRPANAPDMKSFVNDLEFNITTVSGMSCAQLHGLGTLQTGDPGSIDERTSPLSDFIKFDCHNTSRGPNVRLKCNQCQLTKDNYYISWHFIDVPNSPAAAVGFQFNLTAKRPRSDEHISVLSGAVDGRDDLNSSSITLRGRAGNILQFRLVPRLFKNVHDLRLIQAFFHEFIPGTSYTRPSELQNSLQNPKDGQLNITFHINFLSDYIVEIDTEEIMGPVSFLADLGGLYAISIALFFYVLAQFEYRVVRFRYEDDVLQKLEARRRARHNWNKLRRYVMYRWGGNSSEEVQHGEKKLKSTENKMKKNRKPLGVGNRDKYNGFRFKSGQTLPLKSEGAEEQSKWQHLKNCIRRGSCAEINKESLVEENLDTTGRLKGTLCTEVGLEEESQSIEIVETSARKEAPGWRKAESLGRRYPWLSSKGSLPPVPETSPDGQMDISSMQSYLKHLYEYNLRLREDFLASQSVLGDIVQRLSPHSDICRD